MNQYGIGQSVSRIEDPKFLQGQGTFVDDIRLPGTAHAYVLRSPHAHARITSIDTAEATSSPGVLLVLTAADAAADNIGGYVAVAGHAAVRDAHLPVHPVLSKGKVRHVGDRVVLVVAETLDQARDAAEKIVVDYQVLP